MSYMVTKLMNRKIEGQVFRNAVSGIDCRVPGNWKTKVWLAMLNNVPQQFVTLLQEDRSFVFGVPDHDYLD